MISSMSVPICNHFHVRRANSGRITPFKGDPLSSPRSWGPPLLINDVKFCHKILETLSCHIENPKSLPHLVSERYRVVADGRTDRITVYSYYALC